MHQMKKPFAFTLVVFTLALFSFQISRSAEASYDGSLAWITEGMEEPKTAPTLIYGEIVVLVSRAAMYYCGLGWNCSKDNAGGYCGIQHQTDKDRARNVRFSVWDTSPTLPARLVGADGRTLAVHSNDEGSVESTKLFYNWKEGEVFRFVLTKKAEQSGKNTLTTFYFFDGDTGKWVVEATIVSPMDDRLPEAKFHGMLYSFMEDFSREKLPLPRISLFRLWAGYEPKSLTYVRKAKIRGHWGIVNGCFCFAGGEHRAVDLFLAKLPGKAVDVPIHWDWDDKKSGERAEVKDQRLSPETVKELNALLK